MAGVKGSGCGGPKGHPPYPGCETGGRPKTHTDEFIEKQADDLLAWFKNEENVFFDDFCLYQDLNPDLMSEWANSNQKFAGVYKTAKKWQESRLRNGVLKKGYNNGMATLVLTNHHNYVSTKTETKLSGDAKNPVSLLYQEAIDTSKDLVNDPVQE